MSTLLETVSEYAEETEADHFAWWCEQHLHHSVDRFAGQSVVWEGWQMDWWRELLAWDVEKDAPYWRSAALVVARKNGKTQMLAALALYRLVEGDGKPEILLAASSDKQAGRLFESVMDYLRRSPYLRGLVHTREHIGEIVNIETGGKIIRLSSTGESLDGYNPSLVLADELHAWLTPTRRRVWTSLRTAAGARTNFQMVTISTAGAASDRASSILGKMIDGNEKNGEVEVPHSGLTISRSHGSRLIIYNYSAPTTDPSDYKAMKVANPASWITPEFIKEQAEADDLEDHEVLQLHGCVWAETETTFVIGDLLLKAMEGFKTIDPGESVTLGFDGSEFHDDTWLVACTLDGRIQPLERWQRPQRAPEDWRIPRPEIHAAIAAAHRTYNVLELAADPPGWYSEIDEWRQEYGDDKVLLFDTNKPARMAPACERLRTDLRGGEAKFGGPLGSELRIHFGNCVTKETASGIVITKDDKNSPRKIDGAVAAAIAYDRAMWHADHPAPEYGVAGFR